MATYGTDQTKAVVLAGGVLAPFASEAILCNRFPRDASPDVRRVARLCLPVFAAGWISIRLAAPSGGSRLRARTSTGLVRSFGSVARGVHSLVLGAELAGGCTSRSWLVSVAVCGLQIEAQRLAEAETEPAGMRRMLFARVGTAVLVPYAGLGRPAEAVVAKLDMKEAPGPKVVFLVEVQVRSAYASIDHWDHCWRYACLQRLSQH